MSTRRQANEHREPVSNVCLGKLSTANLYDIHLLILHNDPQYGVYVCVHVCVMLLLFIFRIVFAQCMHFVYIYIYTYTYMCIYIYMFVTVTTYSLKCTVFI